MMVSERISGAGLQWIQCIRGRSVLCQKRLLVLPGNSLQFRLN